MIVFGDDGEKLGTWPETHKHCYHDGWLERFFNVLVENQHWLQVTTFSEAIDHTQPVGKIYLPDSSYREMTEWAACRLSSLRSTTGRSTSWSTIRGWPAVKRFVRGGFWRNFKVKYVESDEMYSRMMNISRRLKQAVQAGAPEIVDRRAELYRGQCNCGWHGAFGGIYLPRTSATPSIAT